MTPDMREGTGGRGIGGKMDLAETCHLTGILREVREVKEAGHHVLGSRVVGTIKKDMIELHTRIEEIT